VIKTIIFEVQQLALGVRMWVFTSVADWFDEKRGESDHILDKWVEDSGYSQGAMIVAATTHSITTFGAGFVDVLRLGDGVKAGGLKGWGTDAMRFVAIFPAGKGANILKSVRGTAAAKLVADTGGPNCFWVASAKALRQVGQSSNGKLLSSVEDLAQSLGMHMDNLWTIPNLATGMSYLVRVGAKVGAIRKIVSLQDITRMVPGDGSVLMLAVRVMKGDKVIGGHAIYAFTDVLGRLRFFDRTVGASIGGSTRGIFASIDEIAPYYGATAIVPYEAAVIYNVYLKSIGFELPKLVIPILGVMAEKKS
jgi:hypothetical protein